MQVKINIDGSYGYVTPAKKSSEVTYLKNSIPTASLPLAIEDKLRLSP